MSQQTPPNDPCIPMDASNTNLAPQNSATLSDTRRSESRRRFLGNIGGVAIAAAIAGAVGLEPHLGSKHSVADAHGRPRGSERSEEATRNSASSTVGETSPLYPHGCALSGVFRGVSCTQHHRRAGESGHHLQQLENPGRL